MKAVFEQAYVKNLHGTHVKQGSSKMDLAEQLQQDIKNFRASSGAARADHDLVRLDGSAS